MRQSKGGRGRTVGCGVAAALTVTGMLFGSVPASAAMVTTSGCGATVAANVGDTLALSGRTFGDVVYAAAQHNPGLFVDPNRLRHDTNAIQSIPVGVAANAPATTVGGSAIATAVLGALNNAQGYGGLFGLASQKDAILRDVGRTVSVSCSLTARAANYRAPAPPARPSQPAQQYPGGTLTPRQTALAQQQATDEANRLQAGLTTGRAPLRDYSGLPATAPGAYAPPPSARYGVPGDAPLDGQFPGGFGQGAPNAAVRSAGQARALDARDTTPVQLPMLLAVIAVAAASAGLIRTWVLRRGTS